MTLLTTYTHISHRSVSLLNFSKYWNGFLRFEQTGGLSTTLYITQFTSNHYLRAEIYITLCSEETTTTCQAIIHRGTSIVAVIAKCNFLPLYIVRDTSDHSSLTNGSVVRNICRMKTDWKLVHQSNHWSSAYIVQSHSMFNTLAGIDTAMVLTLKNMFLYKAGVFCVEANVLCCQRSRCGSASVSHWR